MDDGRGCDKSAAFIGQILRAIVALNGNPSVIFLFFVACHFLESGSMALHRDIYWIGRQWAVTGFGLQAVDQRLQGAFDIEVARIWDEGLSSHIRGHAWVNGDDFDKALMAARRRFPQPAPKSIVLPAVPPPPAPAPPFQLRMQGALARFVPQWRVRR